MVMGMELVPQMSVLNQLTQLIAQEDFINKKMAVFWVVAPCRLV
jgi:hypothetical protein